MNQYLTDLNGEKFTFTLPTMADDILREIEDALDDYKGQTIKEILDSAGFRDLLETIGFDKVYFAQRISSYASKHIKSEIHRFKEEDIINELYIHFDFVAQLLEIWIAAYEQCFVSFVSAERAREIMAENEGGFRSEEDAPSGHA